MSPSRTTTSRRSMRFPRVSGDEPDARPGVLTHELFSPRERG